METVKNLSVIISLIIILPPEAAAAAAAAARDRCEKQQILDFRDMQSFDSHFHFFAKAGKKLLQIVFLVQKISLETNNNWKHKNISLIGTIAK